MTQADEKVLRYRGVIKNLPSIKAVVKHAEACVKEMNWFSRHITARGVVQRVKNMKGLRRQELSLPESDPLHHTPASYVLWLDEAGNPQACVIDERSNVPIMSGRLENRDT